MEQLALESPPISLLVRLTLPFDLDGLDIALFIAERTPTPENEVKWKAAGDRALSSWRFATAKRAYAQARDVGALFLLEFGKYRQGGRLSGEGQGVE